MAAAPQIQLTGRLRSLARRGPATHILAGGLLLSVTLSALFYFLLMTIHPPAAFGQPGAPFSVKGWVDAYANWYQSSLTYTLDYRLSLLAALGFAASIGILSHPRLALVASFSLINVYFAWTSSLAAYLSRTLGSGLTEAIFSQDNFLSAYLNLRRFTGDTYDVADLEALALLAAVVASMFLLNSKKGTKKALLRSVQVAALSLIILSTEIAIFDYHEFFLQVTQLQASFGIAPWFSNADLLLLASAIFAASTCLLRFRLLQKEMPLSWESPKA